MAALFLLRHGNAGFGGPNVDDHDRSLNQTGVQASRAVGASFVHRPVTFDLVLCSTAWRARQTWEQAAPYLDSPPDADYKRDLYLASAGALQQRIKDLPDRAENVIIIGHNPGLHEIALFYCGGGDDDVVSHLGLEFPPAALAVFHFDQPWADLAGGAGRLLDFVTPER